MAPLSTGKGAVSLLGWALPVLLAASGLVSQGCDRKAQPVRAPGGEPTGGPGSPTAGPRVEGMAMPISSPKFVDPGPEQRTALGDPEGADAESKGPPPEGWPTFTDVSSAMGLVFTRHSGATGRKHYCEPKGGGLGFVDVDRDGWVDVYLVDGGNLPGSPPGYERANRLFRNVGGERFEDVTEVAGVKGIWYGMGVAAGDYDGDGDEDLFVTGVDGTVLYRNRGDGTFEDVTDRVGARVRGWSSTALFVDLDEDGFLDIYVARYLAYHPAHNPPCYATGVHNYCTPHDFPALDDVVLHNVQGERFEDWSTKLTGRPLRGTGLMVASWDFDLDGHVDLYVANDETDNLLLMGQGRGRFEDRALVAGVAVGENGWPEAGMGVDIGDVDLDGLPDVVVGNFSGQSVTYFRSVGHGTFVDMSRASGIYRATFFPLNFGVALFDADNDTDLDLFVCNGHVWDTVASFWPGMTFPQQNTLMRNDGTGRFEDLSSRSGPGLLIRRPSRGVAEADFDRDGDVDLVYANQDTPAVLLRNDGGNRGSWLQIDLDGAAPNTDGIGAKVEVELPDGVVLTAQVTTGGGYQSCTEPVVHFGLGHWDHVARVTVRWPPPRRGTTTLRQVRARRRITIRQP